jgi:hypothetical protein
MNEETIVAARLLIEFARTIDYLDPKYLPTEINEAADLVEAYLDSN